MHDRFIFIPSKGRPESISSWKLLKDAAQNVFVVVEPAEFQDYRGRMPGAEGVDFLVLPENDKGIAYVRNWILEHARKNELPSYWMFDDDVKQLTFQGQKVDPAVALREADRALLAVPRLAQAALEYGQFSWGAKNPVTLNGYCDVAVKIWPGRVGQVRYRDYLVMKEDRDFTLQLLAAGWHTARAAQVGFVAPKNGSNAGGLKPLYDSAGREATASERMAEVWPGICVPNTKSDGRPDVKINWKLAAQKGQGKRA